MHKQLSTTLLIFLLLSSSLYSSTDIVLAFAHTNNNIHPYHKRHQLYRQYIMQTRGGSAVARPTTKLSTATSNYDDDKTIKSAKQALSAIQYCVKMSFFSVLSNVVSKLSSLKCYLICISPLSGEIYMLLRSYSYLIFNLLFIAFSHTILQ